MLKERKAQGWIELTKKVNSEILQFGYIVRDIDNMFLETLAQSANDYSSKAEKNMMQPMLFVFNIEVSYAGNYNVVLTLTLETLVEEKSIPARENDA